MLQSQSPTLFASNRLELKCLTTTERSSLLQKNVDLVLLFCSFGDLRDKKNVKDCGNHLFGPYKERGTPLV
jgi:hypothetical protein